MKLIGINGFKTSGKDTTYRTVAALAGERVERRAFADKLKIMAALALGFERSDEELIALMDSMKDRSLIQVSYSEPSGGEALHDLTGRQYLQWFGAHARTVFGDSFWVDQVAPLDGFEFELIWSTLGRTGPSVGLPTLGCITDVRYPNEAERVLSLGGVVWEVQRPGLVSDGHSSEKPLPRYLVTRVIDNSGDFLHLEREVEAAMNEL